MLSEKPWNWDRLVRVMMAVLFFVSVFFLIIAAVQHSVGKAKFKDGSLGFVVLGSLGFHGSILLGTGIILGADRVSWKDAFGFAKRPIPLAMLLGLAAALVFLPIGMALQDLSLRVLDKLHFSAPTEPAISEFQAAKSLVTQAYLAFFAVVLAPFAEEVFFRGILYGSIKQFGFPKLALWGSAIIFGLVHLTPGIFLPLVMLSLVLAWLYDRTDNLLAPITAHAVFNAINLILMYFGDALNNSAQHMLHHAP